MIVILRQEFSSGHEGTQQHDEHQGEYTVKGVCNGQGSLLFSLGPRPD